MCCSLYAGCGMGLASIAFVNKTHSRVNKLQKKFKLQRELGNKKQ